MPPGCSRDGLRRGSGGSHPPRQRALTRSGITDAARTLFETERYHDVSVDAIAKAAGVSRAAFYLHFSNKREVLDELIAELRAEADLMWPRLRAATDGPSAVAPLVAGFLEAIERHQGAFRAWMQAGSAGDEITGTTRRDLERVRRHVFPNAAADDPDTLVRVVALVSVVERFCMYWLDHDLPIERDRAAMTLAPALIALVGD